MVISASCRIGAFSRARRATPPRLPWAGSSRYGSPRGSRVRPCATRTDETAAQSCAARDGEGRLVQWQHTHRVRLPSGIEDGQKIHLRERGAPGPHGGTPGDRYVTN
ncbi:DnaJ C-terminal domain-containing protein [Streptomyces californicus]